MVQKRLPSKGKAGISFGNQSYMSSLVRGLLPFFVVNSYSFLVMAMRVSPTNAFALTVSADHIIGRYDLMVCRISHPNPHSAEPFQADAQSSEEHGVAHRTKHPGNGSLAIRDDGKVCAVGGWDGK